MGMVRSATLLDEPRPIRIFLCSCGHLKSEQYCEELEKHLAPLVRQKLVIIQQSHQILPGLVHNDEIIACVYSADIVVLCISSFLFSVDEYWKIMDRAMELRDERKIRVIPIRVSPADYQATRLRELQILPRRKKALSQLSSSDREAALVEIVIEVREVMRDLQVDISREEEVTGGEPDGQSDLNDPAFYKAQGDMFFRDRQYDKAITAYDKAISLDSNFADALKAKAKVYRTLASLNYEKRHEMLERLSEQFPKEMDPPDDTKGGLEK